MAVPIQKMGRLCQLTPLAMAKFTQHNGNASSSQGRQTNSGIDSSNNVSSSGDGACLYPSESEHNATNNEQKNFQYDYENGHPPFDV